MTDGDEKTNGTAVIDSRNHFPFTPPLSRHGVPDKVADEHDSEHEYRQLNDERPSPANPARSVVFSFDRYD